DPSVLFPCAHGRPAVLRAFPTRRSSDLLMVREKSARLSRQPMPTSFPGRYRLVPPSCATPLSKLTRVRSDGFSNTSPTTRPVSRSEEHTSELQSRFDLVCRLLLEKQKIN